MDKVLEHIKGAKLLDIEGLEKNNDYVLLNTTRGKFLMYHEYDCCEHVWLEDIVGNLQIGSTIHELRVKESRDNPLNDSDESHTWTFYTFVTDKGYCDLRWYGESNGFYSESVDVLSEELAQKALELDDDNWRANETLQIFRAFRRVR